MKDEQKYANIVDMASDFNNDKNLILQLTQQLEEKEQENQKLKDRWQEFKNWIDININPIIGQNVYFLHESLLSKMQELEKDD